MGKGELSDFSSQSKTNNGVGTAYGDGSDINMSPENLTLNDPELIDTISSSKQYFNPPFEEIPEPPLWGWVPPEER